MSKEDGGYWLPIHSGLLRDQRWSDLSPALRGVWITLYLLLDGEPRVGWFKDAPRIVWLLRREGLPAVRAMTMVSGLVESGWLVPESPDLPALTLRGWDEYTDARARKAVYNRTRRDRGDRSAEYRKRKEKRAAARVREMTGDSGRPRRDAALRAARPAGAGTSAPAREELDESFGEIMARMGYGLTDVKAEE